MDNNENNNRRDDEQNESDNRYNDERYNDGYYTGGDGNGFDNGGGGNEYNRDGHNASGYNASGYNDYNGNGRYYANDRGGYGGGGYNYNGGNQGGARARVSNKLLISAVAVLAVTLIAAIIGISIFYINVIKPLLDDNTGGGLPSIPMNTGIVDPDFNISQSSSGQNLLLPDAYETTADIFVEINVRTSAGISAGSGFLLARTNDNTGYYIVTNNHVVEGATEVTVRLTSGKEYTADDKILTDELSDLAVITIRETAELSVAKLGKSSALRTGESVYVIGNPLGTLAGTLTNGIISQTATEITVNGHLMSLLQTTAAINPGNSGGPMFNMAGEVVGIVNAKYVSTDVEGIGFAIPIDTAITIVKQMITQGYVTGRNDLGITTGYGSYGFGNGLWITAWDESSSLLAFLTENNAYNSSYYYQIHSINGNVFTSDTQANIYIDELEAGDKVTIVISAYYTYFNRYQTVIDEQTIQITLGQLSALQDTSK